MFSLESIYELLGYPTEETPLLEEPQPDLRDAAERASSIYELVSKAGQYVKDNPQACCRGTCFCIGFIGMGSATALIPLGLAIPGSIAGGFGALGFTSYKLLQPASKQD